MEGISREENCDDNHPHSRRTVEGGARLFLKLYLQTARAGHQPDPGARWKGTDMKSLLRNWIERWRSRGRTSASTRIDCFSLREGWSRVPHPVPEYAGRFDVVLIEAGFRYPLKLGNESGFEVAVYTGPRGFLVDFGGPETSYLVWATDLPSMLDLLNHLAPLIMAGLLTEFDEELIELRQLLTEEADDSPLYDAQQSRWRRLGPSGIRVPGVR